MSGLIPSELYDQVDSFINSQDYLKTSRYWRHLILRHLRVMSSKGVENWGNSVAFNYFTWTRLEDTKLQSLTHHNLEDSSFLKIHKGLTPAESYSYNVITNLLWEHLRKSSHISLKQLESFSNRFSAGNAPTVIIGGMPVTQDLLNSAIEYESFSTALPSTGGSILEIGAGSGRNADFMLSLGTVTKYMIIDIPPHPLSPWKGLPKIIQASGFTHVKIRKNWRITSSQKNGTFCSFYPHSPQFYPLSTLI
jgi:putative sugar O-methyltransferase